MAATKLEISQLVYTIAIKFQQHTSACFWGPAIANGSSCYNVRPNGKEPEQEKIQDGSLQPCNTYLSACRPIIQNSDEIPKAIPTFSRSASTAKLVRELSDVRVNG